MSGKVLRVAVVGASTLLGKELLDEISNSSAAAWDLQALEEGDSSEGQLTAAGDEALVVHSLGDNSFLGMDLVFFAGSRDLTQRYLEAATQAGAAVVDVSGAARDQTGFITRSSWLQGSQKPDLTTTGISVPHPVSLMLAIFAERLQRRFGHVDLSATVLEPASQAGSAGVDELHQQTVSLLSFQELPKAVFGTQVAFNVQGSLGEESQVRLGDIHQLIERDLESVLGSGFDGHISLTLLQAPVFHGYTVSAYARTAAQASVRDLLTALEGGVVASAEGTAPSNQAAIESGNLLFSVQRSERDRHGAWLLLAADNLRLVTRSAVQSALELISLRPGSRVQ